MNSRKQVRIIEAKERQAAYAALSLEAKIAIAVSRRGESKRELAKLYAKLAAVKAA